MHVCMYACIRRPCLFVVWYPRDERCVWHARLNTHPGIFFPLKKKQDKEERKCTTARTHKKQQTTKMTVFYTEVIKEINIKSSSQVFHERFATRRSLFALWLPREAAAAGNSYEVWYPRTHVLITCYSSAKIYMYTLVGMIVYTCRQACYMVRGTGRCKRWAESLIGPKVRSFIILPHNTWPGVG